VNQQAGSRHKGIADGESQDSLRATNALITGFDRVKRCPNIVFLCTSNMVEYLDRAFVDRCSVQIEFTQPSKECQYKILRTCILSLIARKIIGVDDKDDGNARGTIIENYTFAVSILPRCYSFRYCKVVSGGSVLMNFLSIEAIRSGHH
jgi:SpoVK/Ycf46/Vps4 family AAA+-type ATPase